MFIYRAFELDCYADRREYLNTLHRGLHPILWTIYDPDMAGVGDLLSCDATASTSFEKETVW